MKKKRILTIVTIASLSLIAMTGCDKEKNKTNNNVTETADVEATNDVIDNSTNEPTITDEGSSDIVQDNNPQSSDDSNNITGQNKDQNNKDQDNKENSQAGNNKTDKDTVELPIYTINDDTLETEDAIAYIPAGEEITAEIIVNEVLKAFSANSYEVNVASTTQEGDNVIVNFEKNSPPATNVGASQESSTLDCISHSILDNLPSCKAVIFRIDGEAYVSGHIEYGINEPYSTGNSN